MIDSVADRAVTTVRGRTQAGPGLLRELSEGPPWSYPWQLDPGVIAPAHSDDAAGLQQARLDVILRAAGPALRSDRPRFDRPAEVPPRRTLHLGCADGWLTRQLAALGHGQVIGIDAGERNIRRARMASARFASGGDRLEFRCEELAAISTARLGRFELVIATDLDDLEQCPGMLEILARLTSVVAVIEADFNRERRGEVLAAVLAAGFSDAELAHPSPPSHPSYIAEDRAMVIAHPRGMTLPRQRVRLER